jgi:tetratricopeptide (TPR) repeat protein
MLLPGLMLLAGCGPGSARKEAEKTIQTMEPDSRVRLARSYFNGGKTGEAMRVLEEGLREYPESVSIWNYYAQVSFLAGNLEVAEAALLEVLRLNPFMTDAHNTLGAVYQEMGRYNQAEEEYRKALEDRSYGTPEKVYLNLGLLFKAQGRMEEAITMLRRAVERETGYLQAHYELATMLEQTGKLREAIREYGVAEPAYKMSGEFHFRFGVAHMKLGNNLQAAEHFRKVIAVAPGSENSAKADDLLEMLD